MPSPEAHEPPHIDATFGRHVEQLRERNGWSQTELAKKMKELGFAGFHQTTISRIENGERSARVGEAFGLAELLDVSVNDLVALPDESSAVNQLSREVTHIRSIEDSLGEAAIRYVDAQGKVKRALDDLDRVVPDDPNASRNERPLGLPRETAEWHLSRTYIDVINEALQRERRGDRIAE